MNEMYMILSEREKRILEHSRLYENIIECKEPLADCKRCKHYSYEYGCLLGTCEFEEVKE